MREFKSIKLEKNYRSTVLAELWKSYIISTVLASYGGLGFFSKNTGPGIWDWGSTPADPDCCLGLPKQH